MSPVTAAAPSMRRGPSKQPTPAATAPSAAKCRLLRVRPRRSLRAAAPRTWQATYSFFFFFNDTPTTEIYTLPPPDLLPICTNKTVEQGVAWTFDAPTATDNSGSATITIFSTVTNVTGHCGSTFDATRTFQATHACSNSTQCSQMPTAACTTTPVITCSCTTNLAGNVFLLLFF